MKNNLKIGIGITAFKRDFELKRILHSILCYDHKYKFDIAVSIDGYDENLIKIVESYKKISIICNDINEGCAANKNRLMKFYCNYDVVFLAEDDIVFWNGFFVEKYVDALINSDIKILSWNRLSFYSNYYIVNLNNQFVEYNDKSVGGVPAVFLAYRSEILKKVGYFDELYGRYGREHIDFGRRLKRLKYLNDDSYFDVPNAYKLIHYGGTASALTKNEKRKHREHAFQYDEIKEKKIEKIPYCSTAQEPKILKDCRGELDLINNSTEDNYNLNFNNSNQCAIWCNFYDLIRLKLTYRSKNVYLAKARNINKFFESAKNYQNIVLISNYCACKIIEKLFSINLNNKTIFIFNWSSDVKSSKIQFILRRLSYYKKFYNFLIKLEQFIFASRFDILNFFKNYWVNYITNNIDFYSGKYLYDILGRFNGDFIIKYNYDYNCIVIKPK
jgi:hypothetical protein